jgi:hypothetical protein
MGLSNAAKIPDEARECNAAVLHKAPGSKIQNPDKHQLPNTKML